MTKKKLPQTDSNSGDPHRSTDHVEESPLTSPNELPALSNDANAAASLWLRVSIRTFRLALITMVLWCGWNTARSLQSVLTPSQTDESLDASRLDTRPDSLISKVANTFEPGGVWTFAGSKVNVGIRYVQLSDLESQIATIPDLGTSRLWLQSTRERQLAAMLKTSLFRQSTHAGTTRYDLLGSSIQCAAWIEHEGTDSFFVAAMVAVADSENSSRVYYILPANEALGETVNSDHLLPMPNTTVQHMARCNSDGKPELQLLGGNISVAGLLNLWEESGWECRQSGDPAAAFDFICTRGKHAVRAWAPSANGDERLIFLIRLN